jgi:tetrahydromethanopterin S-methyltransferase subunit G
MANTDDVFNLLGDVNAITLKRMEDKADATRAETLKRIDRVMEVTFTTGQRLDEIEKKLGIVHTPS